MINLYVITHKKIEDKRIPKDRTMMLVGAYNKPDKFGYVSDDDFNDNISELNPSFCELTGLYKMWKDTNSEYVGLEHYRRLFTDSCNLFRYKIISKEKIEKYLKSYDIILPKMHCWPNYDSLTQEYKTEHIDSDIEKLEKIIKEEYEYIYPAYKKVMYDNKWSYNYNMFVAKKEFIDEYSEFLFSVLFKLKDKINLNDGRDNYQKRVFGFLSERLFNVFLVYKGKPRIKELKVATLGDSVFFDLKRRIYRSLYWLKCKKNKNKMFK